MLTYAHVRSRTLKYGMLTYARCSTDAKAQGASDDEEKEAGTPPSPGEDAADEKEKGDAEGGAVTPSAAAAGSSKARGLCVCVCVYVYICIYYIIHIV